jgi:hypothetical protein
MSRLGHFVQMRFEAVDEAPGRKPVDRGVQVVSERTLRASFKRVIVTTG